VVVTAVKKAEDHDRVLLRFYEWEGRPASVRIEFPEPAASAEETNLLEKPDHELALGDGGRSVVVETKPFEIKTVKVLFGR
jgi:alpha-mannosidase